jgi:MoaD family protein
MKVKVRLLKPFSDIAGKGELVLEFEGGAVANALNQLCQLYPEMRNELYDQNGAVTYSVNIFINDRPLTAGGEETTSVNDGDEILIFLPVAGG